MMNQKGQTGVIIVGAIIFLLLILLPLFFVNTIAIQTTYNGHHTGTVTAVETNGMIWKTDRAYFKSDAQSSQEDAYCVIDDKVKAQLDEFARRKATVTIAYDDYLIVGWAYCGSESGIITSVVEDNITK
jgi:hypothetical protein